MKPKTFLSIGECMVEMAALEDGHFRLGFAGDTMNTAWYARALMPAEDWNIAYFTRVGDDTYSKKMLEFFEENRIDTRLIGIEKGRRPGLYLIEITDGERSFTYWRDQSAAKRLAADRASLAEALSGSDFIYFSGITLAILSEEDRAVLLEEIAKARKTGKRVAFDPNLRPRLWSSADEMRIATMKAAAVADIVLPSFDDEAATFGDADLEACAVRYLSAGSSLAIIKNGGGPMLVAEGEKRQHIDAVERIKPIDTTGAGDSFNGGFLAALASGASAQEAVESGHRVSLKVIMHRGALMPIDSLRP